jgi:hypothetical protein
VIAPLRELESQIIERANWLADELLANPPGWYRTLRHAASEPPNQELTELTREIVAYRERYRIQSNSVLGEAPPAKAAERRRQHSRLTKILIGFSSEAAERSTGSTGIIAGSSTETKVPPGTMSQP